MIWKLLTVIYLSTLVNHSNVNYCKFKDRCRALCSKPRISEEEKRDGCVVLPVTHSDSSGKRASRSAVTLRSAAVVPVVAVHVFQWLNSCSALHSLKIEEKCVILTKKESGVIHVTHCWCMWMHHTLYSSFTHSSCSQGKNTHLI